MENVKNLVESYSQQIDSTPSSHLHLRRAHCYALLGEPEKAIADTKKAVELDKNNPEAHSNLAVFLIGKGMFKDALKHTMKTHDLDADTEGPHWMIAREGHRLTEKIKKTPTAALYNKRGLLLLYQGALEPAKKDFEAAIKLDPTLDAPYTNLGLTCMKLGLPFEAEKAIDEVGDRNPNYQNDNILQIKKWCFLEQKAEHSPTASIYTELADIYQAQGTIPTYNKAKELMAKANDLLTQTSMKDTKMKTA